MISRTITMQLPENLYMRLQQVAQAIQQPLEQILLRAIQVGSPPTWETAPPEFQAALAALDRLDDTSLWRIARSRYTEVDMQPYQQLLDKNAEGTITLIEQQELERLRYEFDRHMLCKAHAVTLLHWRGHQIPPSGKL